MIRSKPAPARSREDIRAALVASAQRTRTDAVMATPASFAAAAPLPPKATRQQRTRQDLRDSAQGKPCRMRLIGCPRDPAMTIWSHCRHAYAGKGGALKAVDIMGADACTYCDAIYDGQRPLPDGLTRADVEASWNQAHAESIVDRVSKGIL